MLQQSFWKKSSLRIKLPVTESKLDPKNYKNTLLNLKFFAKKYFIKQWRWYLFGVLALALTNIVTLAIPRFAKDIVNSIENQTKELADLKKLAIAIILLGVAQILIRSLSRILIFWPARQIEVDLRNDLFSRCLQLPQTFYDKFGLGDLVSRIANDVSHLRILCGFGFLQLANLSFLTLFTIWQMLAIHTGLTLATLSPLVLMLAIAYFAMPILNKNAMQQQIVDGDLTNRLTEAFINIQTIKLMAAERTFTDLAEVENQKTYNLNMASTKIRNYLWPLLMLQHNLAILIALFYGGVLVIQKQLLVGDIMAFSIYIGFLSFPIMAFGFILGIFQRAKNALQRFYEVQNEPDENKSTIQTQAGTDNSLLAVKNLSFSYGSKVILDNISFDLAKGEHVGIFAPIGSGKTTLFKLITRIYNPQPGTIFLNGCDILGAEINELRNHIFLVEQQPQLLSLSIRENLELGSNHQNIEEIENACRRADVLEDIQKMPQGFMTPIGERGLRLSGGQKQRLSLARGFLREAQLLIMDDVLSAVDHKTEKEIIEQIFATGSALLIASHRLSVFERCDRIILLNHNGSIQKIGTYSSLKPELELQIKEYENLLMQDRGLQYELQ